MKAKGAVRSLAAAQRDYLAVRSRAARARRRRAEAVVSARSHGLTWRAIGAELGVSPQRAEAIATKQ